MKSILKTTSWLLVIALCMFSCKKGSLEDSSVSWQIDRLEVYSLAGEFILDDIEYDVSGKITKFGADSYTYDAQGRLSTIRKHIKDFDPQFDHIYICSYDREGRIESIDWTNQNQDISALFPTPEQGGPEGPIYWYDFDYYAPLLFAPRQDGQFLYTGNDLTPSTVETPHSTSPFRPFLFNITREKREYMYKQGNITRETCTVDGFHAYQDRWSPSSDIVTEILENTFSYDKEPNVYQKLFGSIKFIPSEFTLSLSISQSFLYSKNNMVKVTNKNGEFPINYIYRADGRVEQISSGTSTIKIYYK